MAYALAFLAAARASLAFLSFAAMLMELIKERAKPGLADRSANECGRADVQSTIEAGPRVSRSCILA